MRRLLLGTASVFASMALSVSPAWAVQNPTTGHPGAPTNTCGPDNPVTPGHAAAAPGSPFNSAGNAGTRYAGNPGTASLLHSDSTAAVSQYDTACVRLSH